MYPQSLSLGSEVLEPFRNDIDTAIDMMIENMIDRDLAEGTMTAKLKVIIEKKTDKDGVITRSMEIEPDVGYKTGRKMNMETQKIRGLVVGKDRRGIVHVASNQIDMDEILKQQRA